MGAEGDAEELAPTPEEKERSRVKRERRKMKLHCREDKRIGTEFASVFGW